MKELWKHLKDSKKPIVLYGMGNGADKIIKVLEDYGIKYSGVFASDGFVRDKIFHGFKISSYSYLKGQLGEMIVLLCFGSNRAEVIDNILKISSENEFYAPDVPVIGGELFTEEYVREHSKELEWVYGLLADDLSRRTFENTVKYKISGKIDYLIDCETDPHEPYDSFLKLSDNESFLDLGAYNGDTVTDFVNRTNGYRKITAVEPDFKTFKKLVRSTENFSNTECINAVISSFCGEGTFSMKHGRNSSALGGDTPVRFTTVDALAGSDGVTYIKMDIEGEELNAVAGAADTIRRHSPKMLISCYHRTEDIITIPKAVNDMKKDYRLYMRHFHSLPAWDTNYYFI